MVKPCVNIPDLIFEFQCAFLKVKFVFCSFKDSLKIIMFTNYVEKFMSCIANSTHCVHVILSSDCNTLQLSFGSI